MFIVEKTTKTLGTVDTLTDAYALIAANWNKTKANNYRVIDSNGVQVDISDFINRMLGKGTPKRKPLRRKSMTQKPRKAIRTKERKNDMLDKAYRKWLGDQKCVITGLNAPRGYGYQHMHCHHIHGRSKVINDYLQVPLIGHKHSWGVNAYHNNTNADFIRKNNLRISSKMNLKKWFEYKAEHFLKKYVAEHKGLNEEKIQRINAVIKLIQTF